MYFSQILFAYCRYWIILVQFFFYVIKANQRYGDDDYPNKFVQGRNILQDQDAQDQLEYRFRQSEKFYRDSRRTSFYPDHNQDMSYERQDGDEPDVRIVKQSDIVRFAYS